MKTVFDNLSSRSSIFLGLAVLIASFLAATAHFMQEFDDINDQRTTLLGFKMREGFVSMSDLQRINLVVLDAVREGRMTPENEVKLERAVDFLHVRTESFRRRIIADDSTGNAALALALMENVIRVSDESRAVQHRDLAGLSKQVITISDEARRLLFVFLDELRRRQDAALVEQREQLQRQIVLLVAFLFFLTVIAGSALLLLRREVTLRRDVQKAENRVHSLAYYDSLTNLPNRVLFKDRVVAILERGEAVSMIFVDLDKFKGINDSIGHAAGDAVLQAVAKHLAHYADRFQGTSARLAGDEFALLFPTTSVSQLEFIADAIIEAAAEPVWFEDKTIIPSLSLGIAPADRIEATMEISFETLARVADFCLYASKSRGRGRYTIFNTALEEQFHARRAMLTELSGAIERSEIEIWLQPKILLENGAVYGFEALCRWSRAGKLVRPADFIELAESSGAIVELDFYMMREACRLLADWNAENQSSLTVSVNLSGLHFRSRAIVDRIAEALERSGLPPDRLTLEITETVQLVSWDDVGAILSDIRALGCSIAIDDFGSGYSSLAYLRAMSADELKIDRSLISEIEASPESRYVLDSVIDLAHSLGMSVVVEGVETDGQAEILAGLGCRFAQGFLFGEPMPAPEALLMFGRPAVDQTPDMRAFS